MVLLANLILRTSLGDFVNCERVRKLNSDNLVLYDLQTVTEKLDYSLLGTNEVIAVYSQAGEVSAGKNLFLGLVNL